MKAKQQSLSEHPYGNNHPYIGKPCLWKGIPAIPYGSYFLEANEHVVQPGTRLAILMLERNGIVHKLSGVGPDSEDLLVLDTESIQGKRVLHTVLAAAADTHRQNL